MDDSLSTAKFFDLAIEQIAGLRPPRERVSILDFGTGSGRIAKELVIYCADYHCSHSIAISADRWPDHVRLSELEPRFVCKACGKRGADVRPDFNWNRQPVEMMGYR